MNGSTYTADSSRFSHFRSLHDEADAKEDDDINGDSSTFVSAGIIFRSSTAENGQPPDSIGSCVTVRVTDNKPPSLARKLIVSRFNYPMPLQFEVTKNLCTEPRIGDIVVRNNSGTTYQARYRKIYAIPHPKNSLPISGWDQFSAKLIREEAQNVDTASADELQD